MELSLKTLPKPDIKLVIYIEKRKKWLNVLKKQYIITTDRVRMAQDDTRPHISIVMHIQRVIPFNFKVRSTTWNQLPYQKMKKSVFVN